MVWPFGKPMTLMEKTRRIIEDGEQILTDSKEFGKLVRQYNKLEAYRQELTTRRMEMLNKISELLERGVKFEEYTAEINQLRDHVTHLMINSSGRGHDTSLIHGFLSRIPHLRNIDRSLDNKLDKLEELLRSIQELSSHIHRLEKLGDKYLERMKHLGKEMRHDAHQQLHDTKRLAA
jgi:DNA repair ATPase RecN